MPYEIRFLVALGGSSLIEALTLFVLLRTVFAARYRNLAVGRILFFGIAATVLTIPYVWFVFAWLIRDRMVFLLVAEVFAAAAETMVYFFGLRLRMINALALSILCNLVSFLVFLFLPL